MNKHIVMAIQALEQLKHEHERPVLTENGVQWILADAPQVDAAIAYLSAQAAAEGAD